MKDKFENSIKKQLENREIGVSENAWDRLNQMMEEEKKKPNRKLWIPISIAASVIVLFGIYGLTYFNTQETIQISEPIENTIVHLEEKEEIVDEKEVELDLPREEVSTVNETSAIAKVESKKEFEEPIENKQLIEEKIGKEEIAQPIQELENDFEIENKVAVQTDSTHNTEEKQNYVDPDMLLYSIENNQTIKETQSSNSRMVIIDFNK